jgi:hypothetical protein
MISLHIKTPVLGDLIFSNKIYINYEVKDTEGLFGTVVFEINGVSFEKTARFEQFEYVLPEGEHLLTAYIKNKYGKEIPFTRTDISFNTKPITLELKNELSSVVAASIPSFLEQDYQLFVEFIKAYYRWLEQTKNPNYVPHSLEQFLDIDTVPPEFLNKFYETYLATFPTEFSKDKETGAALDITKVIKRIKEFYSRKGTEDSFRFMFRLMFDTEITFTYPREKMFLVSAGQWVQPIFIKAKIINEEELLAVQGKEIYYLNETGDKTFSAYVDDIVYTTYGNTQVATLFLTNVNGLLNDSYVYYNSIIAGVEETIMLKLYTMVTSVIRTTCKGFDYKIGQKIILKPSDNVIECFACNGVKQTEEINNVTGYGFLGQVEEIDKYGSIQKIKILDPGFNYETNLNELYDTFIGGTNKTCELQFSISYIYFDSGRYKTKKSLLSEVNFLQDNFYYQQNSYEVGVGITPYRYSNILKQNVHPAGYQPFYRYDIIDKIVEKQQTIRSLVVQTPPWGRPIQQPNNSAYNSTYSRNLNRFTINTSSDSDFDPSTDVDTNVDTDLG